MREKMTWKIADACSCSTCCRSSALSSQAICQIRPEFARSRRLLASLLRRRALPGAHTALGVPLQRLCLPHTQSVEEDLATTRSWRIACVRTSSMANCASLNSFSICWRLLEAQATCQNGPTNHKQLEGLLVNSRASARRAHGGRGP